MSLIRYYYPNILDQFFDNALNSINDEFSHNSRISRVRNYMSEVKTDETGTTIIVEMPGVSADLLSVTVKDRVLVVVGKSRSEKEHSYSYSLSSNHDENSITATLKDGLLEIRVNFLQKSQPRSIKIVTE